MISLTYRGDHDEYGHAVTIEYADQRMTIPESVLQSLARVSRSLADGNAERRALSGAGGESA